MSKNASSTLISQDRDNIISSHSISKPSGYKGLYGFHKYWGKKPHEPIAYVIEHLTKPNSIVLDPFVGSGTAARESLLRSRRFIGFDINPVAIMLSNLLIKPPVHKELKKAVDYVESTCKNIILQSYLRILNLLSISD